MGQPYLPTAVIAGAIIADGVLAPHRDILAATLHLRLPN